MPQIRTELLKPLDRLQRAARGRGRGRVKNYPHIISVALSEDAYEALCSAAVELGSPSIGQTARTIIDRGLTMQHGKAIQACLEGWKDV